MIFAVFSLNNGSQNGDEFWKPILRAKNAILEAKTPKILWHEARRARPAECARPLAKLESSELSLELGTVSYACHP